MQYPIQKGSRIVVNGNLQSYARAEVDSCVYVSAEGRWLVNLSWPNAPGGGTSKVWSSDEGKGWYRYTAFN